MWISSPYLQLVPPSVASSLPGIEGWDTSHGPGHFVWDAMAERVFSIPDDAFAALMLSRAPAGMPAEVEGTPLSAELRRRELLVDADRAYRMHRYRRFEIEINTHCNLRCGFCPVASAPKSARLMTDAVYRRVLERVREYGAREISLHHYSEPTLDPGLSDRLRLAKSHGLRVRLHTNLTGIVEQEVEELAKLDHVDWVVNLPAASKETYLEATGRDLFDRASRNLEHLGNAGAAIRLAINAPRAAARDTVVQIERLVGSRFGRLRAAATDDRAGRLAPSAYVSASSHVGALSGCVPAIVQMSISVDGKAFLCCQDFDQELILGDVLADPIAQIAVSPRAVELRQAVFGARAPPANLLCARCDWTTPRHDATPFQIGNVAKWAAEAMVPGHSTLQRWVRPEPRVVNGGA